VYFNYFLPLGFRSCMMHQVYDSKLVDRLRYVQCVSCFTYCTIVGILFERVYQQKLAKLLLEDAMINLTFCQRTVNFT
jgi:hypothetical protein